MGVGRALPRASMIKQRARYSSSEGGESKRGRLVRFFFMGSVVVLVLISLYWKDGGVCVVGELSASKAISNTANISFFFVCLAQNKQKMK